MVGADGGACGLVLAATCLARVVVVLTVPASRGVACAGGGMKEDVCDRCWLVGQILHHAVVRWGDGGHGLNDGSLPGLKASVEVCRTAK